MELRMMELEAAKKEELEKKDKLVVLEKDTGVLWNGLEMADKPVFALQIQLFETV